MYYLIILLLLIPQVVFADVFVVTDNKNNVYSVSSIDDAVIPVGYQKTILKGVNIGSLGLVNQYSDYTFVNKTFIPNLPKIKARQDALIAAQKTIDDAAAAKTTGLAKLKALGLTDAEISAITGGN